MSNSIPTFAAGTTDRPRRRVSPQTCKRRNNHEFPGGSLFSRKSRDRLPAHAKNFPDRMRIFPAKGLTESVVISVSCDSIVSGSH